jgi:hypothetical protein
MNERWLLALALYAVGIFGLWLLRRQSPFSLPVIGLGATMLIGTFYPLMSLYVQPRSWRNTENISEAALLATQVEYLSFAVGLVIALLVACVLRRDALDTQGAAAEVAAPGRFVRFRDGVIAWGLVLGGGLLYGAYVAQVGLGTLLVTDDFASKYLESRGMGTLQFGLNLMIAGALWGEVSRPSRASRFGLRCVAAMVFVWCFLFIAVRSQGVAVILGYLAAYCMNHSVQIRRVKPRAVILLFAAYFAAESYAIVRSSWMGSGDFMRAVEIARSADSDDSLSGVVGGSELSHPFLTAAELLQYEEGGELLGESYVNAATAFIPLFLLPDRPMTLSEEFVSEYYPAVDDRGGGTSFSMVAEAWWNFGTVFGSLLIGLLVGALLIWSSISARIHAHGLVHRVLPYSATLTLLFHRTHVQANFKQVVSLLLPVFTLLIVARVLWAAFKKPEPSRARVSELGTSAPLPMGVR